MSKFAYEHEDEIEITKEPLEEGGPGSGNWHHAGRKGSWGGSASRGPVQSGEFAGRVPSTETQPGRVAYTGSSSTGGNWEAAGTDAVLERWANGQRDPEERPIGWKPSDDIDPRAAGYLGQLPASHVQRSIATSVHFDLSDEQWASMKELAQAQKAGGLFVTSRFGPFVGGSLYVRRRPPGFTETYEKATLFHEFGHSMEEHSRSPEGTKKFGNWQEIWGNTGGKYKITKYGEVSASEGFAEAYSMYALSASTRRRLQVSAPAVHAYMERLFSYKPED